MSATINPAPTMLAGEAKPNHLSAAFRRVLLACGALSSLLYIVATDGIGASQWQGYSRTTQMVSELFANGSPARPTLIVLVVGGYTLLLVAFGIGVWASANGNRALRFTGGALAAYGVSNVVAAMFPLTLGNSGSVPMHIVATNLNMMLMLASLGFGAAAFRGRMRTYTLATIATMVVFGIVSFANAPGPSLWLGIGERISIWAFLLWAAVFALAVWQSSGERAGIRAGESPRRNVFGRAYDWIYVRCAGETTDRMPD